MKSINFKNRTSLLKKIFLILLIGITISCKNGSEDSVTITGNFTNCSNKSIVLELLSANRIDTLAIQKTDESGAFEFVLDSIPHGFLRIKIDDNNMIYMSLKDEKEVNLSGEYPGIARSYKVEGSEGSELLRRMNLRLIESSDKLNQLKDKVKASAMIEGYNMDSLMSEVNTFAQELYQSDKDYLVDFIKSNSTSPTIYMALYQYIGTSPILMIENDIEIFEYALQQLKENNPDLPHVLLLESVVSKHKQREQQLSREYVDVAVGSEAPDFDLPDNNGKKIQLHQFLGNRVVLAFWSSWNKPSVSAVQSLTEFCNKNNFKIILISLDTNKEKWLSQIKQSGIEECVNLCDFKSWDGAVSKIYGVKSLPAYILIDEQMVIQFMTDDIDLLNKKIDKE
ncbi:MAG: TlpA family protein disulfide reductase [Bacteroidales bacterium]|nr:TlpA family protein disulfide reductase [Bacteroidales bacterium]